MDRRIFSARWVFPVSAPPIENGQITVVGSTIESVGPRTLEPVTEDLGDVAILPGFVNAHVHLDLSGARGVVPPTGPGHFADWLQKVIAFRRSRTPDQTRQDIRDGIAECQRYGTTLVGDIAAGGQTWHELANSSLRAVVYHEFIGLSEEGANRSMQALYDWETSREDLENCRKGISPHAPYSVRGDAFQRLASHGHPLSIHLAETPEEKELLAHRRGPFENFLKGLGLWHPEAIIPSAEWLLAVTRQSPRVLFAHGNYLGEAAAFAPNQFPVYCPRTHAAFGHPPHPFRAWLKQGVKVCLGTDSLASNPDLDPLAEAAFVRERYPDVTGEVLLKLIALHPAEALGFADEAGSLEPGKSADWVSVSLGKSNDPYEALFDETTRNSPRRTMFAGKWRA